MAPNRSKGVQGSYKRRRQDWFTGPQLDQLREEYQHDMYAYLNAWHPSEGYTRGAEELFLNEGMEYFKKLEKRMFRQARERPYRLRGQDALDCFTMALSDIGRRQRPTHDSDFVFVAVDFEGTRAQDRVGEFGVARLDTRHLFDSDAETSYSENIVETSHFAFARNRARNFRFGETLKMDQAQLRKTVLDVLSISDDERGGHEGQSMRKILLIGHGISSDLSVLDKLGLPIEDFPQIGGVVDTLYLSHSTSNLDCGSLKRLLKCLDIPIGEGSLHCAGNDANYTLRALLAYLHKSCSGTDRLEELARQPVPTARLSKAPNDN